MPCFQCRGIDISRTFIDRATDALNKRANVFSLAQQLPAGPQVLQTLLAPESKSAQASMEVCTKLVASMFDLVDNGDGSSALRRLTVLVCKAASNHGNDAGIRSRSRRRADAAGRLG